MRPSAIDANLLVVLDALLQEGHVGRASRRLALTPSATSHALARLRELLGDPLLVRVGRRFVLTPRATELLPQVRQLMEQMERIIQRPENFQSAKLERTFLLLTTEPIERVLLRPLERLLALEAPQVLLYSRPVGADAVEQLRAGRADLAFGVFSELPHDICCQQLLQGCVATSLMQIWHRRRDSDPAHEWLRGLTARVASELPRPRLPPGTTRSS